MFIPSLLIVYSFHLSWVISFFPPRMIASRYCPVVMNIIFVYSFTETFFIRVLGHGQNNRGPTERLKCC